MMSILERYDITSQMNTTPPPERPATHAVSGPDWLANLFSPQVNSAIWRRSLDARIRDYAANDLAAALASRTLTVNARSPELRSLLPGTSLEAAAFRADVRELCELLRELTECGRIGVRIAVVETALCPRFHVDHIALRLTCTYVGPGTQVLPNHAVDRTRLSWTKDSSRADDCLIESMSGQVVQAGTGDVVFLKGEGWRDNSGNGAVHRSPPLAAGERRVLLTLEPL